MTPKEKATELVRKHIKVLSKDDVYADLYMADAKKCALISVDEVMVEAKCFDEYYIGETSNSADLREDYWNKVRNEINGII